MIRSSGVGRGGWGEGRQGSGNGCAVSRKSGGGGGVFEIGCNGTPVEMSPAAELSNWFNDSERNYHLHRAGGLIGNGRDRCGWTGGCIQACDRGQGGENRPLRADTPPRWRPTAQSLIPERRNSRTQAGFFLAKHHYILSGTVNQTVNVACQAK